MERIYTIGELSELSGASVRTLRFYEEAGLLDPRRDPVNGYRLYDAGDVDRLQEILLLRGLGFAVRDIGPLLGMSAMERQAALDRHLDALREQRRRLDDLIAAAERTLTNMKGATTMTDRDKFRELRRGLIEDNERRYGTELRERYGDATIDGSNRKVLNMSEHDHETWRACDARIRSLLESSVRAGADPAGPEGARVCDLHRQWLGRTWPSYSAEAHRGLARMYVSDERFTAYYDRDVPGCATWLRDAIVAHAS